MEKEKLTEYDHLQCRNIVNREKQKTGCCNTMNKTCTREKEIWYNVGEIKSKISETLLILSLNIFH